MDWGQESDICIFRGHILSHNIHIISLELMFRLQGIHILHFQFGQTKLMLIKEKYMIQRTIHPRAEIVQNICLYQRSSEIKNKNSCVHWSHQEASETNKNKSLVKIKLDLNKNRVQLSIKDGKRHIIQDIWVKAQRYE